MLGTKMQANPPFFLENVWKQNTNCKIIIRMFRDGKLYTSKRYTMDILKKDR
jgi:hypothetical protein